MRFSTSRKQQTTAVSADRSTIEAARVSRAALGDENPKTNG